MFKNPLKNILINVARKNFEIKTMKPMNITHFQKKYYSQIDRYLNKLNRPLYQYIIGANLAVYLAWQSGIISPKFLYDNFSLSLYTMASHRYHTLLTYSFSHIHGLHLAANMLSLYFFGKFTEAYYGPKTLLQLYLLGALVSGIFIHSSNKKYGNPYPTIGASGAASAILTYYIMNFPNQMILLFFFPVPAWMVGVLMLFQSLYAYDGSTGLSGAGHLGGIVAGLFYYFFRRGGF